MKKMRIRIYEGKLGHECHLCDIGTTDELAIPHKGELIRIGNVQDEADDVYEVINTLYDYADNNEDGWEREIEVFVKLYDWES